MIRHIQQNRKRGPAMIDSIALDAARYVLAVGAVFAAYTVAFPFLPL